MRSNGRHQDQVFFLVDLFATRQFGELLFVEAGRGGEIKIVEGYVGRETGLLDAAVVMLRITYTTKTSPLSIVLNEIP